MAYVYQMKYEDAVQALADFFIDLCDTGPEGKFNRVDFPAPEFYTVEPGGCTLSIAIDGITGPVDKSIGMIAKTVNNHRIELRIVHPYAIPADEIVEGMDTVQYAQLKVIQGTGVIVDELVQDWSLGRLVRDSDIAGSIMGPLFDQQLGENVHAHEIILITT